MLVQTRRRALQTAVIALLAWAASAPVFAQRPSAAAEPSLIRVETINIRSNPLMALPKVEQDVQKSADLPADVVFRQEISPHEYKALITAYQPMDWRHAHLDLAIPISYRVGGEARWDFVSAGREQMHEAKAGISPIRWINWVILKDKTNQQRTVF